MSKQKGTYYVEIKDGIILAGEPHKTFHLSQCQMTWIHSNTMHVIRMGRDVIFLPVRLMTKGKWEQFQKIMQMYATKQIFVTIDA